MIHQLNSLYPVRYTAFALCVFGLLLSLFALVAFGVGLPVVLVCAALVALGVYDLQQTRHAILRNYPVLGHLRETQLYIQLQPKGLTLFDLPRPRFTRDYAEWQPIVDWLNNK